MLKTKLTELLGIEYPIFQGGMSWIADAKLAAAVSEGGGLGIIAADTVRGDGRLTGNVAVKTDLSSEAFVGFENHGGRTFLDGDELPLGTSVVTGTGNNGEDGLEGCLHRNLIGTYLHGPALSKNPDLADWLIERALERRLGAGDGDAAALLPLAPLDDECELAARAAAMRLLP